MSAEASKPSKPSAGIAAACERLVHPSVTGGERRRQGRLIGTLLAGPFLAAAAVAQSLAGHLGTAATVAAACATLGAGLLVALLLIATAKRRLAEHMALVLAAPALGIVLAASGGAASPLAVLLAAPIIEAAWGGRTRKAALAGLASAVGALGLGTVLSTTGLIAADPANGSAWHWLVPLAYGATLWPRLQGLLAAEKPVETEAEPRPLEELIDAVVLHLDEAGDVVDANRRAAALLGLPCEMLLGSGLFDRVHVADRVAYLCALSDLREGASARKIDLRLRLPAAETAQGRYAHFSAEIVRDPGTGLLVAVLRDGSRLAELTMRLEAAREAVEGMEIAKSRFMASVSHELRTPLNAILGFSDVLSHEMFGSFSDKRQLEYVRLIHDAGSHLLAVVNAILDVSKIESGTYQIRPEVFRFEDAVQLSLSMTEKLASDRNVSVTVDVPADIGEVYCDRRAVQQVLINLLCNAIKFTPEGGGVTVTAERIGERLQFHVSDTGIGISAEDLKRIGKPFMQVENDYTKQFNGTGLGLALVKGLVGLQGGGMTIESAPGAGTCVSITLPVAEPEDATSEADAAAANQTQHIDDGTKNETIRKTA
ncbi:two-component system, cell cycle sensor histidine kinase DivJ [Mesorhizobium sp. J18]|nr:two-component system, cell cycle sensor histidine kinase DivJ [Mesorhizobium sp. J18]